MTNSVRVAIFIDGSNFYHALKSEFSSAAIQFERLIEWACRGRTLVRTYYFNVPRNKEDDPQKYAEQQKFFSKLETIPYFEVGLGRLEKRSSDTGNTYYVEKGVDIALATKMLAFAYKNLYDVAILITGDGDFSVVVQAVKELGKHVELVFTRNNLSLELKRVCDVFHEIDQKTFDSLKIGEKATEG